MIKLSPSLLAANFSNLINDVEKAEKAGHYSAYISSGDTGHEGGDLLVRDSIAQINEMWSEEE